jgi:hypothetical protein
MAKWCMFRYLWALDLPEKSLDIEKLAAATQVKTPRNRSESMVRLVRPVVCSGQGTSIRTHCRTRR